MVLGHSSCYSSTLLDLVTRNKMKERAAREGTAFVCFKRGVSADVDVSGSRMCLNSTRFLKLFLKHPAASRFTSFSKVLWWLLECFLYLPGVFFGGTLDLKAPLVYWIYH